MKLKYKRRQDRNRLGVEFRGEVTVVRLALIMHHCTWGYVLSQIAVGKCLAVKLGGSSRGSRMHPEVTSVVMLFHPKYLIEERKKIFIWQVRTLQ